jgi:hypothetical protein
MNFVSLIDYLRKNIRPFRNILLGVLAAIVLCDLVLPRHGHYFIDRFRAYWTLFSIAGCFLLLKIGKGVAHMFLSRDEDYYDN